MSSYGRYDDEPKSYHTVRTRRRDRDDPDYMREDVYVERGNGATARGGELVYRGRDRDDSVEDIDREFPPPGPGQESYYRRTRSMGGKHYDDYDDDRHTDYAAAGRRRSHRERRRRDDRDYDSDRSQTPPRDKRKSIVESLGLGGIAGALLGSKKDKDNNRDRSPGGRSVRSGRSRSRGARRYSSEEEVRETRRSRSRGDRRRDTERKWAQSAQAALVAGAVEAFRVRKEPGPWKGEKGKRIATAALASGAIDGFIDRDPNTKKKRHLAEAVIGGLAVNRLANGSRSKSRARQEQKDLERAYSERGYSPDGRYRSRSRSIVDRFRGRSQSRGRGIDDRDGGGGGGNGALKGLAAGGALAAGAAALYQHHRSKSRKRRSPSNSSADSYVPSRNRRRFRRRSPGSDTNTRQIGGPTDRALARGTSNRGSAVGSRAVGAGAGAGAAAEGARDNDKESKKGNESSSSSTTGMENKQKKMRGKELITAGLATVATIHAAHSVYSSMEGHQKRHKLVAEGEMTVEEARKKQTKAWIQDAAAVGIAALGIKGAFSEWKEMNEHRKEIHEIEERKRDRRKKRIARQRQEERETRERMLAIMEKNPQFAMGYQMRQDGMTLGGGGIPGGSAGGPAADQSGNPYAPR